MAFSALGLELRSPDYVNGRSPLAYVCQTCGFKGEKSGQDARSGYGCPRCTTARLANSRRSTISEARVRFEKHGLKLLSKAYVNSNAPLKYLCLSCGYEGKLSFAKAGYRGCKMCAIQRRSQSRMLTPSEMSRRLMPNVRLDHPGPLGLRSRVSAACSKCGNAWVAALSSVIETGCPQCSKAQRAKPNAYTYGKAKSLLAARGFELLSDYGGAHKPINLPGDACGHVFTSTFNNITQAKGCPKCARNVRRTLQDYLQAASRFGGQLLRQGSSSQAPSTWRCPLLPIGHVFERSLTSINALGTFCTKCSSSHSEMLCKAMLARLFKQEFSKVRLRKMRSMKGRPLELDLYNRNLKLAVEHNGAHHYEPQQNWAGEDGFETQQANDEIKRQFCKSAGILLVTIRELGAKTSLEEARQQLFEALKAAGRTVPDDFLSCKLDGLVVRTKSEEYWDQVLAKARSLGLDVLDKTFMGAESKIAVRCQKSGHKSLKTPRSIKSGEGCRECFLQRLRRPILTSDGRTWRSGADCARALGVRKETINRAVRTGRLVRGLNVVPC